MRQLLSTLHRTARTKRLDQRDDIVRYGDETETRRRDGNHVCAIYPAATLTSNVRWAVGGVARGLVSVISQSTVYSWSQIQDLYMQEALCHKVVYESRIESNVSAHHLTF